MPSLGGFLKKKRTKEQPSGTQASDSATRSSIPTSPVASKPPTSSVASSSVTAAVGAGNGAAGATPTTTSPQSQQQQQQQQMNPAVSDPQSAPGGPVPSSALSSNSQQHLPSMSAFVNPAQQHDASAINNNSNNLTPQPAAPSPLSSGIAPPPSASPGTDPALLQKQQQQAMPAPSHQPTPAMQHQNQVAGDQAASQQQQQILQQKAQLQQQPQSSQGSRSTKGKYSLADFEILRTLGTGSFGRVHLVQSNHNQRFYAVKVLKKAQVVKMKQVEHTNDERRMLSDVKHPFLVTLWGTFQDVKNLYMVMDFVEGGELFSLLRKSGRFPNPVAKFYAAEVTLALEYMHSKNIVYRDLKPENLLLDRHGHLKITDFGFAKRVPDKTWTLCGTPDYLAPEVVSNKGYNRSVDWWSLGILIYEMLCGYTPFWDSGSPMKIYENILKGKIKYPAYINPDAQNLLERLITADLTKRLGNLYGGSQDVKSHPWFSEVTWDRLARKDIDAPYTPPVKAGAGDASQFDRYPEETEKYGVTTGSDDYGHMFTEF